MNNAYFQWSPSGELKTNKLSSRRRQASYKDVLNSKQKLNDIAGRRRINEKTNPKGGEGGITYSEAAVVNGVFFVQGYV